MNDPMMIEQEQRTGLVCPILGNIVPDLPWAGPVILKTVQRLRALSLLMVALATIDTTSAQSATDACSYGAGSQYTVNSACTYQTLNKPGSFVANYNPGTCNAGNYDDAYGWFQATATTTNITYNPLNNHDAILHVFSGACGSLVQVGCADANGNGGNETLSLTTVVGTNYQIRIQRYNTNNSMDGSICVWSPPPPPTNDDPCGATALTLATSCTFTTFSSVGATNTAGIPAPGCSNYGGQDVWFSFVAPASGAVTFRTQAGSFSNLAMALYDASGCSGTFTVMECDDNHGPGNMPFLTFTDLDLTPGTTYYLRVWRSGGGTGTFDLCAEVPPATGDCFYILRMYDSFGDGWDGSTVEVSIAGSSTFHTLTNGQQDVAYLPYNELDVLMITYTAAGAFQNEISYLLQRGAGIVFEDGPSPTTGLVHASSATCVAPDPPRGDCSGGLFICGGTTLNDNPSNTGLKADLNVNNRGCLNADERQGTWYYFSPSASGTVEFTISPADPADDYDFAVWGPDVALTCPPSSAPYRCNYSGATGDTGLNTSATNDSEDAGGSQWSNEMVVTAGEIYTLYISNFSRSGLDFSLTFSLTNGASLDCTVLPVELAFFDAVPEGDQVVITWSTSSEHNSDKFIVERSEDGAVFAPIGELPAQGNTLMFTDYTFVDDQPLAGVNYYRLVMRDLDGAADLSPTRTVHFQHSADLTLFPNPASEVLSASFIVQQDGVVRWELVDMAGRTVRNGHETFATGAGNLHLPVSGLEAGTYMVRIIPQHQQALLQQVVSVR